MCRTHMSDQESEEPPEIRNIRIAVTQEEFADLAEVKGDRTWREAIVEDMVE